MASRILIVEPDDRLRESLRLHLSLEGYQCDARSHLGTAVGRGADHFDLAVVNLMSTRHRPTPCGTDLESMRVPTLLLAGADGENEAISALEEWADDYLTLPVEMRELIARAHALIRRMSAPDPDPESARSRGGGNVVHDNLLIDPSRRHVELEGHILKLTEHEFQLLRVLARRPGVVFQRPGLLSELWGANTLVPPRSIDALVMRVRRQMRTVSSGWQIATVRGIGYQFKRTMD
jgi:DNA-binding response OmpR family regulator